MTDSNGLYYMRARYYNPDIKRFINQDIKVGDISNGQSLNRYAYCEGNPVSLIDPFGLSPETSQDQGKLKWLHTTLDVVGLFWDGADVINAAVYAMEGNAVQAGISLACALPFVGNVVAGVAKGTKLAKMGNLIGKTLRTAGKMYMTTAAATTALDLAGDAKLEEAANGGKPSVSSMVKKAGALFLGAVAAANGGSLTDEVQGLTKAMDTVMNTSNRINADAMSGKCGKGDGIGCFIAGTKVKTAEGDRNIEEVEVGDYVLAENVETGEQEYKQVTETFTYEKTKLVHVYVGDEEIETTVEHPFYVEGLGFVSAGELQAGDIIRTSDGRKLPIKKVEIEELEETVTVYNFEVEDFHTYYVSELGVLVHNECPTETDTVKIHGNSKKSKNKNHVYVIVDEKGNMVKVGISGRKINKNGTSPRANPQVKAFNKRGMNTRAIIVENNLTRVEALELEQKITDKYAARNLGAMPSQYHKRPKARVSSIEEYIDLYGETPNKSTGGRY